MKSLLCFITSLFWFDMETAKRTCHGSTHEWWSPLGGHVFAILQLTGWCSSFLRWDECIQIHCMRKTQTMTSGECFTVKTLQLYSFIGFITNKARSNAAKTKSAFIQNQYLAPKFNSLQCMFASLHHTVLAIAPTAAEACHSSANSLEPLQRFG